MSNSSGKPNYCYYTNEGTTITPTFTASSPLVTIFCLASTSAHLNITGGDSLYSFLGNDTYYPSAAQGTRYSSVIFSPYSRYDTDCIEYVDSTSTNISLDTAPTSYESVYGILFYMDSNGVVQRNKEGFICPYYNSAVTPVPTPEALPTATDLRNALASFRNSNPTHMMALYGYPHLFEQYGFSSVYLQANMTYYEDPPLDPRSPKDYSRRGGLKNICGNKACNGNTFSAQNGGTDNVHDVYYQSQIVDEIARRAEQNLQ